MKVSLEDAMRTLLNEIALDLAGHDCKRGRQGADSSVIYRRQAETCRQKVQVEVGIGE